MRKEQQLEQRQVKERQRGGHGKPRRLTLFFKLLALFRRCVVKAYHVAGEVYGVPVLNGQTVVVRALAVDPDSALGEDVIDRPDPVVAARENGVHSADALAVYTDVRRAGAPY